MYTQYVKDALDAIDMHKCNISYQNGEIKPYNFGGLYSIGCEDIPSSDLEKYLEFIYKVDKRIENIVFVFRDQFISSTLLDITNLSNRVEIVYEKQHLYALKLDFIILTTKKLCNYMLYNKSGAGIYNTPFEHMPDATHKDNYESAFNSKNPFIFDFLSKKENFQIKEPIDITRLYYQNSIPDYEIIKFFNSPVKGIDAYIEFLALLSRYPKLVIRQQELFIKYMQWVNISNTSNINDISSFLNIIMSQ